VFQARPRLGRPESSPSREAGFSLWESPDRGQIACLAHRSRIGMAEADDGTPLTPEWTPAPHARVNATREHRFGDVDEGRR